jgi:hypothetical protein
MWKMAMAIEKIPGGEAGVSNNYGAYKWRKLVITSIDKSGSHKVRMRW